MATSIAYNSFGILNPYLKTLKLGIVALPCVQCVRYKKKPRRKPMSMPRAPSKMFNVRVPTPIDPDEYKELEVKFENYRAALRGVR